MSCYVHPVLDRDERTTPHTGIMDLEKGEFVLEQSSTLGWNEFTTDIDKFLAEVRRSHDLRRRLGIPLYTYHAYSFPCRGYDIEHVRNIIEWARGHDMELRIWVNESSMLLLLVIADPDVSEDSGIALYEYVKEHAYNFQAYGLSSWFEFCQFGTPVPDDWPLVNRGDNLFAASPDGRQVVMFG